MLEISFYPIQGKIPCHVSVSENLLLWLARSEFSKIGTEVSTELSLDGEKVPLLLVPLGLETRKRFIVFFTEAIVEKTKYLLDSMLNGINTFRPDDETIYSLKKLIDILDCLKDETYQYLRRL